MAMFPPARRRMALGLAAMVAAAGMGLPAAAQAQTDFPNKPVTLVTPFGPGSGPDAVLRIVADKLSKIWNQRAQVENKPGANGFLAIDQVRRAPADGYTLIQFDSEHLSALPHLYKQRNFNTLEVFDPIAVLFRTPFMLAVSSESKWRTVGDLIAAGKAKKLTYGTWGVGSPGHLGAEYLEVQAGVPGMTSVHFRDFGQLFTAVGSGDLDFAFASIPSSSGAFKAGKLKYLAVAASQRIPQMPDVPTFAEAGGPAGFEVNSFVVLAAPKGVPAAVRNRIAADVAKALAEPDLKERFNTFAFEILPWNQQEIARQAELKSKIYGELIRKANITLE